MASASTFPSSNIVGLIPAAGQGRRLGPLPCSKEVYPIAINGAEPDDRRVKVASEYLLDSMRVAGVRSVFVVLRDGKWDIPAYWGDGHRAELNIGYLMMGRPYGTPFTLDQAHPFLRDQIVVMGFPDVLFEPADAFVHLLEKQRGTGADVVLGLFPASHPEKVDMVELDAEGRPRRIVIKPKETHLTYTWICGVWTSVFTSYLHEYLADTGAAWDHDNNELYLGHVLQAAMRDGLSVEAVCFPNGHCADIGTVDELADTLRRERGLVARS